MGMEPFNDEFLNKCKKITEDYDKIMGTWSLDSGLFHVVSELAEIKDVTRNKNLKYGTGKEWTKKLLDEVADLFLTSISLTNIMGISNEDLNKAIKTKLAIVEDRVIDLEKKKRELIE